MSEPPPEPDPSPVWSFIPVSAGAAEDVPPLSPPGTPGSTPPAADYSGPTEPPLLASYSASVEAIPPPAPAGAGLGLKIAIAVVGVALIPIAIAVSGQGNNQTAGYRIGFVAGEVALWPLLAIGLLSIFPRFRSKRSRRVILLVAWGFSLLGNLADLGRTRPAAPTQLETRRVVAVEEDEPDEADAGEAGSGPAAPPAIPSQASATLDFSTGSADRLIKQIDGAQAERYRAVADAYVRECAARPADAVLAVERVRFIEHFSNSEDVVMEGSAADHAAALKYLTKNFPKEPGTVLYLLERKYGEKLEAAAKGYEYLLPQWTAAEQAEFHLLRAEAAGAAATKAARDRARKSFDLKATVRAGLLVAGKAHDAGDDAECAAVLLNPVFDEAEPWQKKQKLRLLLKLDQPARAVALYEELKAKAPRVVQDVEIATGLAQIGKIEQAREIFDSLVVNEWNQENIGLQRFRFEIDHGDSVQALGAYRKLRGAGLLADPFGRHRLTLLLRHPGAAWTGADLAGPAFLFLLAGSAVLSPLLLLLPVHYWSLLRSRKGRTGFLPASPWGLRQAWMLLGTLMLANVLAIWAAQPELMRSWFVERSQKVDVPAVPLWWLQVPVWIGLAAMLVYLLGRARAWRLLGPGQWSIGQAIGTGLASAVALRVGLVLFGKVFPKAMEGEIAAMKSQTNAIGMQLYEKFGAAGLLTVLAAWVPLVEETLFRGVLLHSLGKHVAFFGANAVQSLVFAAVHENYHLFPFFFAFGFLAGELSRRSGGLLASMIMHSGNNALACVALMVMHRVGA